MQRLWTGIDVLINNAGIGMRTVNPKFLTDIFTFSFLRRYSRKSVSLAKFAENEIMVFSVGVAGSTGCLSLGR